MDVCIANTLTFIDSLARLPGKELEQPEVVPCRDCLPVRREAKRKVTPKSQHGGGLPVRGALAAAPGDMLHIKNDRSEWRASRSIRTAPAPENGGQTGVHEGTKWWPNSGILRVFVPSCELSEIWPTLRNSFEVRRFEPGNLPSQTADARQELPSDKA